jgi:hypothetical protein
VIEAEISKPRIRRSIAIGLGVFLLALVLRLIHLGELVETEFFDERPFVTDARYYDMRAADISEGDIYGTAPAFLSPHYCNALSLVYRLPGFGLASAKYVQAVLGAFSALLIFLITRKLFGDGAGALAGFSAASYGLFIYYAGVLLPATLLLFLHLVIVWVLINGVPSFRRILLVGLLVGLTVGTKANALLLLPAIAAWLLYNFSDSKWGAKLSWIGALVLGSALSLAPITYGNYETSGEFVLVATTGGRNLLKGNGATANGTHIELNLKRRTSTLGTYLAGKVRPLAAVREDNRLRDEAVEYMLEHPGKTAGLWLRKALIFLNRAELGIRDSYPFARTQTDLLGGPLIGFGLIIPIGLAGFLLLAFRDRNTALIALITGTQLASFMIVFVLARYRVVAVALLIVFAGGLLAELIRAIRQKDFQKLSFCTIAIAVSIAVVHRPIEGLPEQPTTGEQLEYLGESASLAGQFEKAIGYFEQAEQANFSLHEQVGRWRVRSRVGRSLLKLERVEDARELWTKLYYDIGNIDSKAGFDLILEIREELNALPPKPQ